MTRAKNLLAVLLIAVVIMVAISSTAKAGDEIVVEGDLEVWTYYGEFTVTTYCGCHACNGEWTGQPTASGAPMEVGRTIAVDPSMISLGREVRLDIDNNSLYRQAQDTGSAIKGEIIDLLIDDCGGRVTYYEVSIWVLEEMA